LITIAGWMLDPLVCSGVAIGRPRVELAQLIELLQLLRGTHNLADSRIDDAFIRQKILKNLKLLTTPPYRQMSLLFDNRRLEGRAIQERDNVIMAQAQILM
jgi:hypothetical protein